MDDLIKADWTGLWHPQRNGDLKPQDVKAGSHKKVWWRCEKGHDWEAPMFSVALEGCGCPYCTGKKVLSGDNDLATTNPELTAQWDWKKNGSLKPEMILPFSHEKVWWCCELGHSWQAAPFSRTRKKGSGCPYCTGRKVLPGFNDLKTLNYPVAKEWYQTLNGTLKPTDVTPGSNKKVWWQCAEGHVWEAAIYSRTRKNNSGCPICAGHSERSNVFKLSSIA